MTSELRSQIKAELRAGESKAIESKAQSDFQLARQEEFEASDQALLKNTATILGNAMLKAYEKSRKKSIFDRFRRKVRFTPEFYMEMDQIEAKLPAQKR